MESRVSAPLHWRGSLLGVAVLLLGACAAEMSEMQPTPAPTPIAAPSSVAPPAPTAAEPAPPPAAVTLQPAPPAPAPAAQVTLPPPVVTAAPPLVPPAPAPRAPIEVTGVEVQENGPSGLIVTVATDGVIGTYESFTLPDPPRLVLDIPDAVHAIPQPVAARPPLVTAIRSSQYREQPVKIVRLVFDLRSPLPFQVATADNHLRVRLGTAVAANPTPPAAPGVNSTPAGKVTRVDLQSVRGRQRIVIGTRGRVTYDVTEASDPERLLIDVNGAQIEPSDARTLDLRQVTSPLTRLEATQFRTLPDPVVRVVADLRSPTRYEVRQTPSSIVVELLPPVPASTQTRPVRPPTRSTAGPSPTTPASPAPVPPAVAVTPAPPTAPLTPATGRLSMDFKDADINNLLRIIAEVSGMNVVAGGDVTGKVTVRLVNVEWQQALDVILKINGMGYELDGNIIRVAPLTKLEAERKAREDARVAAARAREAEKRAQVQVEPLVTKVVAVNYAKASEVVKNLDRLKTPGRPDASIAVDERTNTLIIQETSDTLAKMETLLRRLDIITPQVLIEARIIEANRSFSQSLGVEYSFLSKTKQGGNLNPISVFSSLTGTTLESPTGTPPISISFPAAGTSPAGIGLTLGSVGNLFLGVRLSAAESEGKLRTLSAPKVATLDNQEAEIRQGTQVPYTTVDASGRTVVAFQDAFIRLKVTPHITNDRRVSMKIEAERSFPGDRIDYAGGFAFVLEQRKASTNVLVSNGSTIVIGGLMQTIDTVAESGIPWLKNVPIFGSMFKNHSIGPNSKFELLIFLTPTILEEPRLS